MWAALIPAAISLGAALLTPRQKAAKVNSNAYQSTISPEIMEKLKTTAGLGYDRGALESAQTGYAQLVRNNQAQQASLRGAPSAGGAQRASQYNLASQMANLSTAANEASVKGAQNMLAYYLNQVNGQDNRNVQLEQQQRQVADMQNKMDADRNAALWQTGANMVSAYMGAQKQQAPIDTTSRLPTQQNMPARGSGQQYLIPG